MNILVTGGAGYIGSHTCKALALSGHNPITYDNLSTGHKELVKWGVFEYGDILDNSRLQTVIKKHKINGVIHFAALSTVGESVNEPNKYYYNNVAGTLSLLEAMRLQAVSHIVVSSTCSVYGAVKETPIAETAPVKPINPYGTSKATMEYMLADYYKAFGMGSVALRYFNAAGADKNQETGEWHDPETHLIPRVIMAAWHDIPELQIFGNDYPTPDGTCIRDYIHVEDLADAHVKAMNLLIKNNELLTLNLGTGTGYSVQEILNATAKILNKNIPHSFVQRRDGDPAALVAQSDKAQTILDWKPQRSDLENILIGAAKWYEKIRDK
ncbi:UDP-glucose 4-epimerase GalE [Desulfovibrio litoralis]|uniref:UDP-glucose 4-epimerase n=1 Tax=Desulfovibrio litoralis DSM 11393 TaxID=1121455 RepID=A0A1M7S8W5_9BACT|nr:UDP-glucose 4-epimerase GalE [Desulfovibrio litoralis]SHN54825.1 UDP-glucose 4-epimerase [Desulfovibrio litoralis DSM 11393]